MLRGGLARVLASTRPASQAWATFGRAAPNAYAPAGPARCASSDAAPAVHEQSPLSAVALEKKAYRAKMADAAIASGEVSVSQSVDLCTITLNRPSKLHALTTPMVEAIYRAVNRAEYDPLCYNILIKSAPGAKTPAFCAGGDVRLAAEQVTSGNARLAEAFFETEYNLSYRTATLATPYYAFMDGIVMGGGAGLAMHGRVRVATERTVFAMPECRIGLFPDVGASYWLNKLPGEVGLYLALTGTSLTGWDVYRAGLATHFVESSNLPGLESELMTCGNTPTARIMDSWALPPPAVPLDSFLRIVPAINTCFVGSSVDGVIANIKAAHRRATAERDPRTVAWCDSTLAEIESGAPSSLRATMQLMRESRGLPLDECLRREYRVMKRCLAPGGDFVEGVTSRLVDKRPPRWGQGGAARGATFTSPLPRQEDELPLPATIPQPLPKLYADVGARSLGLAPASTPRVTGPVATLGGAIVGVSYGQAAPLVRFVAAPSRVGWLTPPSRTPNGWGNRTENLIEVACVNAPIEPGRSRSPRRDGRRDGGPREVGASEAAAGDAPRSAL